MNFPSNDYAYIVRTQEADLAMYWCIDEKWQHSSTTPPERNFLPLEFRGMAWTEEVRKQPSHQFSGLAGSLLTQISFFFLLFFWIFTLSLRANLHPSFVANVPQMERGGKEGVWRAVFCPKHHKWSAVLLSRRQITLASQVWNPYHLPKCELSNFASGTL